MDVKGNIIGDSASFPNGGSDGDIYTPTSSFNLVMNGTGTQMVNSNQSVLLQNLTINKPSGAVNLAGGFIILSGNWTNSSNASVPVNAGTSTVIFGGTAAVITGSTTFSNIQFGYNFDATTNQITVATGTVLTVQGTTYFSPHYSTYHPGLFGGGEIDAQGNVALDGTYEENQLATSTFNLVMNGTGTQIIADQAHSAYYSPNPLPFWLQSLTINKSLGVVMVSSTYLIVNNALNILKGEMRLASGPTPNNNQLEYVQFNGPVTVASTALLSAYPGSMNATVILGSSMVNNGTIFFAGDGSGCTLPLPTDVTVLSSSTGIQVPWSGSGTNIMRYVDAEDQGASVGNPITDWNGTSSGDNANWTFATGNGRPELVQSVTGQGGSGTPPGPLTFPAYPHVGDLVVVAVASQNQAIAAPTDNASDTYTLISSSSISSPSEYLNLYYANNITATSSFTVTLNGTSSAAGTYLTAGAYEYTGMAPSSTFVASSTNTATLANTSTQITSLSAAGQSTNELYFGAAIPTVTGANFTSTWSSEFSNSCGGTCEKLFVQDLSTSTIMTVPATWTSNVTTTYAAAIAVFRSQYLYGYASSGTLDSATFDTGITSGAQLNSFTWRGDQSNGTAVKFQFAVSNSAGGPWSFLGPSGDGTTYFSGNPGTVIDLLSTNNGYDIFAGYRYFRYRTVLFSDPTESYTPTVNQIVVNWSP